MMKRTIAAIAPLTLALAACGGAESDAAEADAVSNDTLAQLVGGVEDVSMLANALDDSGLSTAFDSAAAYTVFAPTDAAFEAWMQGGEMDGAQEAAILRSHIVPGFMTMEDITGAVDSAGGEVSVAAMDGNDVTFTRVDEGIEVSGEDGASAMLVAESKGTNGVVITIDGVLKPRPDAAAES